MSDRRDERVFLVRMWLEASAPRRDAWRGSVQDVASGRKFYVGAPAEVAEFIAGRLNERDESETR